MTEYTDHIRYRPLHQRMPCSIYKTESISGKIINNRVKGLDTRIAVLIADRLKLMANS